MIYIVQRWAKEIQEYIQVFGALTHKECEDFVSTKRMIGDRTTYLIRKVC